jgi:hypothetical protein
MAAPCKRSSEPTPPTVSPSLAEVEHDARELIICMVRLRAELAIIGDHSGLRGWLDDQTSTALQHFTRWMNRVRAPASDTTTGAEEETTP